MNPLDQIEAPVDQPSRLPQSPNYPANENAPVSSSIEQQSVRSDESGRNRSGGGIKDSEIQWPEAGNEFWQWPQELQIQWALNRQTEARFDQMSREYTSSFPESVQEAIHGVAWSMLAENQRRMRRCVTAIGKWPNIFSKKRRSSFAT
jgi:hypothetical protein